MKKITLLVLAVIVILSWGTAAFLMHPNSPRKKAVSLEAPTYETRKVDGMKTFILLDKSGGPVTTKTEMNYWLDNLSPGIELQKGHIVEDEIRGYESHTYYYIESIRVPKK